MNSIHNINNINNAHIQTTYNKQVYNNKTTKHTACPSREAARAVTQLASPGPSPGLPYNINNMI